MLCRRPPRQCCCVHCSTRRSCGCDFKDWFRDAVRGLSLWVSGPVAQGGLRLQETGRPGECLVCCLPGGEEDGAAAGLCNVNETRVPTLPCSNESTCEVTAEETWSGFRPSTKIVERRSRASNSHGGGAVNVRFGCHTLPRPRMIPPNARVAKKKKRAAKKRHRCMVILQYLASSWSLGTCCTVKPPTGVLSTDMMTSPFLNRP